MFWRGGSSFTKTRRIVHQVIRKSNLSEHKDKSFQSLSGGNKRKVAIAIATIHPSLIMILDEPTTGVDIMSCQEIWNNLKSGMNRDRTLLLSSHSMNETETLCDRIAILVEGTLVDSGSPEELKKKYGKNFLVKVDMGNNGIDESLLKILKNQLCAMSYEVKGEKEINFLIPRIRSISEQIRNVNLILGKCSEKIEFEVMEEGLEEILAVFIGEGRK